MKRLTVLVLICFLFQSCNSVDIESFETKIINYEDLPNAVKEVIFEMDFIDLNEVSRYDLMHKKHWLMSWVNNSELNRKSDGKRIKLNFKTEHGSRYIIHKNILFVPRHYNIHKADSLNYSFSCFKLE